MQIFLHKRINYGHVTRYAYAYRYLFTSAAAETAPKAVWLVRQTQPQTRLWLTVNSFPKSRMFANT